MLSIYYYLVIVHGYRATQLRKIRFHLDAIPILTAVALSFAGIPYYAYNYMLCMVPPVDLGSTWTISLVFSILPICITFYLVLPFFLW
jgi:hypothetical protein